MFAYHSPPDLRGNRLNLFGFEGSRVRDEGSGQATCLGSDRRNRREKCEGHDENSAQNVNFEGPWDGVERDQPEKPGKR